MIKQVLDLHIHSKYSRACSRDLELPKIAVACVIKGIDICATGDFTHPGWLEHIKENLEEIGDSGLYKLKSEILDTKYKIQNIRFILSTEIPCIYKHRDATRRLHLVILAPNIAAVEKFIAELEKRGANLRSDGRPIVGLSAKEILKILLEIDERFVLIPAHAWTPWFSVFGSKSGYNSLEECFEELTPRVRAIETGLSSDPTMNRRLSALDKITLVSNSDAHSPDKLGREANVFSFEDGKDINFDEIKRIIETGDRKKFLNTIEFFPEEGKYHFDGHADCGVCFSPTETKKNKGLCPKCGKKLTVGVLYRVDELADRNEKDIPADKFIPHLYAVPLREIIAKVMDVGPASRRVAAEYDSLIKSLGSEFSILLDCEIEKIEKNAGKDIAAAIANMRAGRVKVNPGYDGIFGTVEVLAGGKKSANQSRLF